MRSPHRLPAPRQFTGFTLTELLVVIAIIAVLASLLFPLGSSMINRSRKVEVISDMRSIRVAALTYYNDYHKYPINLDQTNAGTIYGNYDTVFGDPDHPIYQSSDLFNTLRGIAVGDNANNILNPSQTVYWQGNIAKNPNAPREGITPQDVTVNGSPITQGSLVDPWGHAYVIWFDACPDGDMTTCVGWFYNDTAAYLSNLKPGTPPMGILIGSLGPDGMWGTKGDGKLIGSDDIVSWQ